jgi:murein L,D-transpeptidase YcbB/YkuD
MELRFRRFRSSGRLIVLLAGSLAWPSVARPQADSAPPPLSLRLNLAARRLDLFASGVWQASYRVAVGMWEYPTPTGSFQVKRVVWRPWWIPPIADWTVGRDTMPPGPDNPMGRVKLYFKPQYFFHGTPDVASIGTASSHGCVRLRNRDAIAIARRVMLVGLPGLDSARVATIARDTATTTWRLKQPVPITIVYETIEWRQDTLRLYPDIYGFGVVATVDTVLSLLTANGFDAGQADTAEVYRLVEESEWRSVVTPVSSLLR